MSRFVPSIKRAVLPSAILIVGLAVNAAAARDLSNTITPPGPDAAAAAAAGPVSTAAFGARCIGATFDDTPAFQAAIDTGHTVYAPALGGRCHIIHALVMKTPGQIFHGDGRARTKIAIEPGFAGAGVFVAQTGEPGPVWRDFSVSFVQPDVDDRAKLTRYPPAFYAQSTPRFEMDHMGCYVATTCVDMKGNSGGATIADLQMSAFEVGIDIDGARDTVRILRPHWYIFSLTPKQQDIFLSEDKNRPIAMRLGRTDSFVLDGGLFFGGLGLQSFETGGSATFGTITNTDFDSGSGIELHAGNFQISSCDFTVGLKGAQALDQSGGQITISSSWFFGGAETGEPIITTRGGDLTLTGSEINLNGFDLNAIFQTGQSRALLLSNNRFIRDPNKDYNKATLRLMAGKTLAIGNFSNEKRGGHGLFAEIMNDNSANRFIGNSTNGWPPYAPSSSRGTYLFN